MRIMTTIAISTVLGLATTATAAKAPDATAATASAAGASGKMTVKKCGAQWSALSDADKAKFNDEAKGKKSAKGGKITGYNVYTKTVCFKKT